MYRCSHDHEAGRWRRGTLHSVFTQRNAPMMKIQAALLTEPNRHFLIETLDLAEPAAGEVLVKIAASGVCHSDWHVATGDTKHPMPCVVGHEGAGIVQAV